MLTLTQVNIEARLLIEANRKHGRQIERSNKCSAAASQAQVQAVLRRVGAVAQRCMAGSPFADIALALSLGQRGC
jgi:hypothetical protein